MAILKAIEKTSDELPEVVWKVNRYGYDIKLHSQKRNFTENDTIYLTQEEENCTCKKRSGFTPRMTDFRSNYYIDHTIETITMTQEIDIPLDLKRVALLGAEETKLGDKKGALKQYRKGNLHIREYKDKLTVHTR